MAYQQQTLDDDSDDEDVFVEITIKEIKERDWDKMDVEGKELERMKQFGSLHLVENFTDIDRLQKMNMIK